MTTPISRILLAFCCLVAMALGSPECRSQGFTVGNGLGDSGPLAHGNDGVGGIERGARFPAPGGMNRQAPIAPGAGTLLPPPPSPPANDLNGPGADLGGALPGSTESPLLVLSLDGQRLQVRDGLPDAPLTLVVGLERLDASFKGGVLVPRPDLLVAGLALDSRGELNLALPDLPPSLELIVQAWFADPQGPEGLAATNGLAFTGP